MIKTDLFEPMPFEFLHYSHFKGLHENMQCALYNFKPVLRTHFIIEKKNNKTTKDNVCAVKYTNGFAKVRKPIWADVFAFCQTIIAEHG